MIDDWSLKEATIDDLCKQALKHYDKISNECSSYNSLVPKAIKYYNNHYKRREYLRKKLIDDVKKESPDWYCVVDMINRRFGIHE